MRKQLAALAIGLGVWNGGTVFAQETFEQRLERQERRLDEMERRHAEELRQRDQRIAELESQQRAATPTTSPAETSAADEIERTRAAVLEDIERREQPGSMFERFAADMNPRIAVIGDFIANYGPDREFDAYNRADVREVELDLRAAIDPRADGVVILAFERDVHNEIFEAHADEGEGEEEDEHEEEGVEDRVSVEEAYAFLHDFGVPNLTAKLGRFHVRFGRQNLLHLHDLPTTSPPLVLQTFLAPEALVDSGASLSYVIPPRYTGGQYVEAIVEVITGEGAGSEGSLFGGDIDVDSPAVNTHLLWNTDLTGTLNLELGTSWMTGHASGDNAQDINLFGVDATLLRRDPTGGFNNQVLQAEAIYGDVDGDEGTNHALGAYVLGQQQLNRDWYLGLRLDWTENPLDDADEAWGVMPYVSWYWSEFLRFRFSYEHRDGDIEATDAVWAQMTFIFGAHPPHPYWSMR